MDIGYARVSTSEQNLDSQLDALNKTGCGKIFTDVASGGKVDRTGLAEALEFLRHGDTLVVWKLDRLGRSLRHLIDTINELHRRKIGFRSVQESLDTTTSAGKLFFHLFGALAEFEREIIRERTRAGLTAARARGRRGGRPRLMTAKKIQMAATLLKDGRARLKDGCGTLGVSKATLYRHLTTSV
jgi:DNA invertase Pin-like site-specific DNA recombinase